ncbi:DUF1499 domain-containing protein [uncultured Tateyamaria sp.]|uniref:DUF1499 domain-containing protein n=1 Tax=uncultured Tateyamaria sp. TaxID=455651 RepID=UPI00262E9A29|nr:DUF1499 domain-containing protein [uncultured Tateyamaria sp.]
MKIMLYAPFVIIIFALIVVPYIRFAPAEEARWHVSIKVNQDRDLTGGAIRVVDAPPSALADVDRAARALPRTQVFAGSVADNHITYVTRSHFFGFPDYTTIQYVDGQLKMFARLRFGRSDLGVNGKRLERLLGAVQG